MSDNRSSMHRPVEVLFFFVLPALILALLVLVPPHGFDLRLSGFFFDGEFTYRRHPILENVLHDGVKLVPYTLNFPKNLHSNTGTGDYFPKKVISS